MKYVMVYKMSGEPSAEELQHLSDVGITVVRKPTKRVLLAEYSAGGLSNLRKKCPNWAIGPNQQYSLTGSQ